MSQPPPISALRQSRARDLTDRLAREAAVPAILFGAVLALLIGVRAQPFSRPQLWAQPQGGWPSPWYAGSLWLVEITALGVAAARAIVVALRDTTTAPARKYLLVLAATSVIVALDDLLQLHDPGVSGISTWLVLVPEALVIGVLLLSQRRYLGRHDPVLLLVTAAAAGLWLIAKAEPTMWQHTAIESGSKFAAMIGWATYVLRAARRIARGSALAGVPR